MSKSYSLYTKKIEIRDTSLFFCIFFGVSLEKMKEDFINDEIITFYLQGKNYELMVNHTEAIKWYKKIVNYGGTFKDEINDYSRNIIKMSQESLSKLEKEDNNKK
jgi:hypothetical protein